jgi:hypothetical protein
VLPGSAAADPNSPVTVTLPPSGVGDIFVLPARLVADLEQDYTEEEFFVSGKSTVYTYNEVPVPGEIIVRDPNVPYTTRIIIRRPTDPNEFNGTVVIEWWNSTAGFDTDPVWQASAEYFARKGIVYVGVTNSTTAIENLRDGCTPLPGLPPRCGTRYAALEMSENGQAFEMVSQIAHMLKGSGSENPLFPDYPVERIFHAGQSQQGGSIVTYATAFHFSINDGYFVQAAGSARRINYGTRCEDPNAPAYPDCTPTLQGDDRRVATDLPVPVYRAQTQSDMGGVLGGGSRQTDTVTFRYYEMAGTAHNPVHKDFEVVPAGLFSPDPLLLESFCQFESNTLADGPVFGSYLYNAMWENMELQVRFSTEPPTGDLMEVDPNNELALDPFGNVLGGIRLPQLDLPIASYTFPNAADPNLPVFLGFIGDLVCRLSGNVIAFDEETLASLYPDRAADFVDPFNQAIDDLVTARFLLPEDAAKLRLAVENKEQQKCIVGLNKNFAKVASAQGKAIGKCIKDGSKGKLPQSQTIEQCMAADHDKVADAKAKTHAKAGKECVEPDLPDFGATDPNNVNEVAVEKELDLIHDLFGSDLDDVIVKQTDVKAGAKCQIDVAKAVQKCQDAKLKEFTKCKKSGLKDATIHDALTLADCMGLDPGLKIDKACNEKLFDKLEKKCADLELATLFPGECGGAAGLTALKDCLDWRVECRVCLALDAADDLARDCDPFDDGLFNGSCP